WIASSGVRIAAPVPRATAIAVQRPHSRRASSLSGRNASSEYRTGAEVRVPTRGRRLTSRSKAINLATGVEPFNITMVSPACTSFNSRERWVFA
ncbi:MAG: hypothetical protein OXH96_23440, partial [Spirochaetaceae bacterium]|nr:hypothetical protein [Spirochaetaceae bacterium]